MKTFKNPPAHISAQYNTDPGLWRSTRQYYAEQGITCELVDGMIHASNGQGWVARFRDSAHALEVMLQAGFRHVGTKLLP